jgi:hypothetical protein
VSLQFFTWLEVQSLCLSISVGGQNGGGSHTQEGQLLVRISIFDISYNQPGSYQDKKDSINGHGFHNFASFLVIALHFHHSQFR